MIQVTLIFNIQHKFHSKILLCINFSDKLWIKVNPVINTQVCPSDHHPHLPHFPTPRPPPALAQSLVLVHSCATEKAEMSELSKFGVGGEAAFVSTFRFAETIDDYVEFPKYLIQQPYVFL